MNFGIAFNQIIKSGTPIRRTAWPETQYVYFDPMRDRFRIKGNPEPVGRAKRTDLSYYATQADMRAHDWELVRLGQT